MQARTIFRDGFYFYMYEAEMSDFSLPFFLERMKKEKNRKAWPGVRARHDAQARSCLRGGRR